MEHLEAMCKVLDLSLDSIVLDNADEAKTAVEQRVIRGLRELSSAEQEYVLTTIEMLRQKR
jgi:hypothetical protein